ncbi:hypothetical protein T03_1752 [Trichinella britovi]|uniref:Uncharacterized protein n=1 Tax=Trichinella britovi TaxID=45882 RepID=A0A0V1CC18_TRIBR|nr:hypothetical protein T03_1752 [Trichinella britovi]
MVGGLFCEGNVVKGMVGGLFCEGNVVKGMVGGLLRGRLMGSRNTESCDKKLGNWIELIYNCEGNVVKGMVGGLFCEGNVVKGMVGGLFCEGNVVKGMVGGLLRGRLMGSRNTESCDKKLGNWIELIYKCLGIGTNKSLATVDPLPGLGISILIIVGSSLFHISLISVSYRIRGKVDRDMMILLMKKSVSSGEHHGSSKMLNRILSRIIIPYSAINRKANSTLENSMLKPLTSSLSASARSKGLRLVSAKIIIVAGMRCFGLWIGGILLLYYELKFRCDDEYSPEDLVSVEKESCIELKSIALVCHTDLVDLNAEIVVNSIVIGINL